MAEGYDWDAEPIEQLGVSIRVLSCLRFRGVTSIGQLCGMSELELLDGQSWGETAVREIRVALATLGLHMRDPGG